MKDFKEDLVEVRLLNQHEHEGVALMPGAKIKVIPDTANWLISIGRAEKVLGPIDKDFMKS